jgi:hypothetical protein
MYDSSLHFGTTSHRNRNRKRITAVVRTKAKEARTTPTSDNRYDNDKFTEMQRLDRVRWIQHNNETFIVSYYIHIVYICTSKNNNKMIHLHNNINKSNETTQITSYYRIINNRGGNKHRYYILFITSIILVALTNAFTTTTTTTTTTSQQPSTSSSSSSSSSFDVVRNTLSLFGWKSTTINRMVGKRTTTLSMLPFLSNHGCCVAMHPMIYYKQCIKQQHHCSICFSSTTGSIDEDVETDNESDMFVWYKLFIDDDYKVKFYINANVGLYIATIKKLVKQEYNNQLKNIGVDSLRIFSGTANDIELKNDVIWDRTIHGGGTQNPLIVKAYEQSKYLLYNCD